MRDQTCKSCGHFVKWRTSVMHYESQPDGVCAAPRPLIGLQPQREVKSSWGKNCPMWEITNDQP